MRGKTFKLIYFSLGGSEVKEISLEWRNVLLFSIGVTAVLGILIVGVLAVFTDFFQNIHNRNLSKDNIALSQQLSDMGERIEKINDNIDQLAKTDADLRIFVDMPALSEDVSAVGTGGSYSNYPPRSEERTPLFRASELNALIVKAQARIDFLTDSRNHIQSENDSRKDQFNRTPSVPPVYDGYRITDIFGLREHPVTGKFGAHEGVDFSGSRGDPVYATANGTVEYINNNAKRSTFGRMVRIDHGYGITTVYAHLHKINVNVGDTVTRFHEIGQVGDTGRVTGPHLHYEVRKYGKPVDPMNYIFERDRNK